MSTSTTSDSCSSDNVTAVPASAAALIGSAPAAPPPSAGLAVWDLPGMRGAHPADGDGESKGVPSLAPAAAPAPATAEDLLGAIYARAPGQYDVLLMVQELLPYLRHATQDGPLRGYVFDVETSGRVWQRDSITELAVMDLATGGLELRVTAFAAVDACISGMWVRKGLGIPFARLLSLYPSHEVHLLLA